MWTRRQQIGLRRDAGLIVSSAVLWGLLIGALQAKAAGVLTPVNASQPPLEIRSHVVNVTINNGFARTEVLQAFYNPGAADLEAIYAFPVPQHAALSELTIYAGEREIQGEVLPREQAERIYGQEKARGNDAGLARKNGYQTFEFFVTPVKAQSETRVRFVYYEPLVVDTGVVRYVYPLEEGGTDECGASFWTQNDEVKDLFAANVELKYAWPVADVRVPGFEAAAAVEELGEGHQRIRIATQGAPLARDLVVYFRLADELPARVELIPYKPAADEPGTFMLVVTPGVDLPPLAHGADYVFVLDVSGSMQGKIQTLARGVGKVLRQMSGEDRFRVVTFNNSAQELTGGWTTATTDAAQRAIQQVEALTANGSTNLYDGLQLALRGLEADRATSVVMVTDGVTNTGVVDPQAFDKLVQQVDIRFFGFLLGNSANWPLVELIANRSGGFYASVSNADDIIGQIMLAKSKVLYECLHDAELRVDGVDVFDLTDGALGKVYRGQQLVLFGRYQQGGPARLELLARRTGTDEVYTTTFDFPDVATADPEIERLWAMNRIEALERQKLLGDLPVAEATQAIEDLAVAHQIVTDETSMVALPDEVFAQYGVQRHNQARVAVETQAQSARAAVPAQPQQYRVDRQQPMFQDPAPTLNNGGNGRGGGAVDPFSLGLVVLLGGAAVAGLRQGKRRMDGN